MKAIKAALLTLGLLVSVNEIKAQTFPWYDQWNLGAPTVIYEQDVLPVMWVDWLGFTKFTPVPIRDVPGITNVITANSINAAAATNIVNALAPSAFVNYRAASVSVNTLDGLSKTVTFNTPFPPGTTYSIGCYPSSGTTLASLGASNKTTNGFTLNLSVTIASGTVDYQALVTK